MRGMVNCVIVLLLNLCFVSFPSATSAKKQPPHIIVIIADDLGWNDVSFHGSDEIPTPNIDALAYNGVILQRHYALPTCSPSRAAFLTGRYPYKDGMNVRPLVPAEPHGIPLNVTLMPQYLRELGYSTSLIGKWHVGYYTKRQTPSRRGFDKFLGSYNGFQTYFNHSIKYEGLWGYDFHRDTPDEMSVEYNRKYITDLVADEAASVISSHDPKKPLFLLLSHLAPHLSPLGDSLEVRSGEQVNDTLGYITNYKRRKYAGLITALDESVGRVITTLQQFGMLENSIVLFFSDNGAHVYDSDYGSNHPLRGYKFSLFEGGVRVASFIYSPLIAKPFRVSQQLIHVTDWLPTLYKIAGGDIERLEDIDGVDQWPAISNDEESNRSHLLVNINNNNDGDAALDERFKLVQATKPCCENDVPDIQDMELWPKYDPLKILRTSTAQAVSSISRQKLTASHITELRKKCQLSCDTKTRRIIDCSSRCLFDLKEDVCEITDVSEMYPEIVKNLTDIIEHHKAFFNKYVDAWTLKIDTNGLACNLNGVWMPWIDDEK